GAGRGVLAPARRPAVPFCLAPPPASGAARRWARAHRRGMVDRSRLCCCRCDPRLLPRRGRRGPALLAVPRRPAGRSAAALVRPRRLCLIPSMPELPPKKSDAAAGFGRLSRSIGDGSLRFLSSKRAKIAGGNSGPAPVFGYAELQVTSNFSFLRGASHPDELVVAAAALGHGAIAITDHNSVAGLVRAHHAAKTVGIRLVISVRLDLADDTSLLAFPEDRAAYGRLTRLLTLGKRRAPKGECRLDYADVVAHGEGQILVVVPPEEGDIAEFAARVAADFPGRAYLAAHHLYRGADLSRLAHLARAADESGLPLLAMGDVLYHIPERRPLQDVLTCIREHCTITEAGFRLAAHAERHLKPASEMARLFRGHEDALVRTLEIVGRVHFSLEELRYEYPEEPVPEGMT